MIQTSEEALQMRLKQCGFSAEDAMNTAGETLARLQQDGKLFGVISHVPALKERIGTQIPVTPLTSEWSVLTSPGCGRSSVRHARPPTGRFRRHRS